MQSYEVTLARDETVINVDLPSELKIKIGCRRGLCGNCLIEVEDSSDILFEKNELENMTLDVLRKNLPKHRLACQCTAMASGKIKIIKT